MPLAVSVVGQFPVINLVVILRRSTKLQEDEDLEVEGLDAHAHGHGQHHGQHHPRPLQ